jgi:hypothetical protein
MVISNIHAVCWHMKSAFYERQQALEKLPSATKQRPQNAMIPDKKPSEAENFSMKFSQRVKNATPAAISSSVPPVT